MHRSIFTEHKNIVLISASISLLMSIWCVYLDPVVNNDGIQYIRAAQRIENGEFSGLLTTYKWPFYPFLIAIVSSILPLHFELAAHAINAGLAIILVIAFISLVYELGATRKTVITAAAVILLYPTVNELRSEVIRDIGYVAFYLSSITFLLRYFRNNENLDLIGWLICMFFAILFRVEGVILLFSWPIVTIFLMDKGAKRNVLIGASTFFALVVMIFIFLLWSSTSLYQQEASLTDGVFDYISESANQIYADASHRIRILQNFYLEKFSSKYAIPIYVFTLLLVLVAETIAAITIFYFVLGVVAVWKKLVLQVRHERIIFYFLIVTNLIILLFFTFARLFLTDRYALSLSITILALTPFAIVYLVKSDGSKHKSKRWIPVVIYAFVVGLGVDGLTDSTNKHYIKEAGLWFRTQSPPSDKLLTNSRIFAHYSGHDTEGHWKDFQWSRIREVILGGRWRDYDYMALKMGSNYKRDKGGVRKYTKLRPIEEFRNAHGDTILIYRVKKR